MIMVNDNRARLIVDISPPKDCKSIAINHISEPDNNQLLSLKVKPVVEEDQIQPKVKPTIESDNTESVIRRLSAM